MLKTSLDPVFFINHREPLSLLRLSRYLHLEFLESHTDMVIRNSYSDKWLNEIIEHTQDKGVLEATDLFNNKRFDAIIKDFIIKQIWTTDPEWLTRHGEYLDNEVFNALLTFWVNDVFHDPKIVRYIKTLHEYPKIKHYFINPQMKKEWETYGPFSKTALFKPAGPASFIGNNKTAEYQDRLAYTDFWKICPDVSDEIEEKLVTNLSLKNSRELSFELTLQEIGKDSFLAAHQKLAAQFIKKKSEDLSKSSVDILNDLKTSFSEEAQTLIQKDLWAKLFYYGRLLSRFDALTVILLLQREGFLDIYGDMKEWSRWGISALPMPSAINCDDHLRSHHLHLYLPPFSHEGYCSMELLEITAAGRVPVCFNTKNIHEFFDSSAVFNTNDISSLISWIKDHLAKPHLLEEKGKLLRHLTEQKHLWKHRFEEWRSL